MKFSVSDFLKNIGQELVLKFNSASNHSHPHAIGRARECGVIEKLEALLPSGVGVGSGFVIDLYGGVSKQSDIVIYEKNFASRFIQNNVEDYAYYSCENVLAVGEVKSNANSNDIKDSIEKLKLVKQIQREKPKEKGVYRNFFTSISIQGVESQSFDPVANETDQIFTFLIAKTLPSIEIIHKNLKDICGDKKYLYPNCFISVEGKSFYFASDEGIRISAIHSNGIYEFVLENPFAYFINHLTTFIQCARTTRLNNYKYLGYYENTITSNKHMKI
ncbi:hypothetical protein A0U20_01530 [Campylobacter lari]|uniref:DUF6602 domain-containing protein n=1 Tax=unclassified Campylobacter TaxID=2593542 RepID=UPI001289EAE5|nr:MULTISPECIES: DUF6602 domain-containing protein [unclassified Campylobacter]EAI4297675.1 hypothetical protein [Campylobacter lari]EAK3364422.1 hypothetical protein [Campylobacter lari]MCV3348960.1 hypothetical protein [Campylobacter sp. RKI_CA19_01127]MCV3355017.1 hypothetical protein [Campylobacter sp. RKI_CA19_01128]HEC1751248.1 hypothetical protein [Campylobacter lari]